MRQLAGTMHRGDDFSIARGTHIRSPLPQKLTFAGWGGSYGNLVKAATLDGRYLLYYAHLQSIGIKTIGKIIQKGQVFAYGDSTGNSTGDHLHFGVWDQVAKRWINPSEWLKTYSYEDAPLTKEKVIATFERVWKRKPALGDWLVFWRRIELYEITGQVDLEDKMDYWAIRVWGIDRVTFNVIGNKEWQRMKEKYI